MVFCFVLTERVVRRWRRLPSKAGHVPSLDVFKARLDGALGSLIWWLATLPTAGRWNWVLCKIPSNLSLSVFL